MTQILQIRKRQSPSPAVYQTLMSGYNPQQWIDGVAAAPAGCAKNCTTAAIPLVTRSSQYGQPNQYQLLRNMRLGVSFTF
jgi:hypothetical protein